MKLRPMKMSDALQMLEWKNYPETRRFAIFSHKKIKKEDHLKWLKKNIRYFKIIDIDGTSAGAIRVQEAPTRQKEVSIWIDKEFQNKGLATTILKKKTKIGFIAKIVLRNTASMRCFIKAGYIPYGYYKGYYLFKKEQ